MKSIHQAIPALACTIYGLASLPTFSQSPTPDAVPLPPTAIAEGSVFLLPPAPAAPPQLAQVALAAQDAFVYSSDGHTLSGAAWPDGDHFNLNENSQLNLVNPYSGGSKPRTLVIRSGEIDPKTVSALEEDLNVMSRILAKAIREKAGDDDALTAMGMKIRTLTVGGNSSVENLYLDGYGVLFMLHARFPLLPPPEPAKEEVRQESADSTWDEARRELYGPKKTSGAVKGSLFFKDSQREAYDAQKVARLKEALVESLKNAANIRHLKPDEHITIVVLGKENAPGVRAISVKKLGGDAGDAAVVREYASAKAASIGKAGTMATLMRGSTDGETILTIRVKKSDVDAFAKGALKLEDFQKQVSITTY